MIILSTNNDDANCVYPALLSLNTIVSWERKNQNINFICGEKKKSFNTSKYKLIDLSLNLDWINDKSEENS